jgi:dihydroorotase
MTDLVLVNARLPDGRIADISVADGVITHIGSAGHAEQRINCRNRLCIPAATDIHVHMRDGVQEVKEDWSSGTKAAAAGGVAAVVDQPNTVPPLDSVENFKKRVAAAREKSYCHFGINGAVTPGSDFRGLQSAGALAFGEMFAAPSSYGCALDEEAMRSALSGLAALGALVTVHAEQVVTDEVHTLQEHDASRPVSGEAAAVDLVNRLSPGKLHYCHMSSADSASRVRGTFEVAPHHLFLSWEGKKPQDTLLRMNPPLRTKAEQRKLWEIFDRIPVIASDHAPHALAEKAQNFSVAPSGVPGGETMMPLLMHAAVYEGRVSLSSVIQKTVTNPCTIMGLVPPSLSVGSRADIAMYANRPKTIHAEHLHYKCHWTPYERMKGLFPELTVISGTPVWHRNEFVRGTPHWLSGRGSV